MDAFVTPHAVARFRERIAPLPEAEAKAAILASLGSIIGAKNSETTGAVTVRTKEPYALRVVLMPSARPGAPPVVSTVLPGGKSDSPSDARHARKSRADLLLKKAEGMKPLVITAFTPRGFCASDPWSPAIDGILAYWHLRATLGEEVVALTGSADSQMKPVEGLPLATEVIGNDWWYCCSMPVFEAVGQHRRHYHRRFDDTLALDLVTAKKVATGAGPFKPSRLSELISLAPQVQWHVIGDADHIRSLLAYCTHIGRGPSRGHGEVTEWRVAPGGDPVMAAFSRPLPTDYADRFKIAGRRMLWGIRPPGRLASNIRECVLPGADDANG